MLVVLARIGQAICIYSEVLETYMCMFSFNPLEFSSFQID
jgi:hypothetical protein